MSKISKTSTSASIAKRYLLVFMKGEGMGVACYNTVKELIVTIRLDFARYKVMAILIFSVRKQCK